MPPESGGSQFLDTGTAIGLFTLAIVLVLKTILPYFAKFKANKTAYSPKEDLKTVLTYLAKLKISVDKVNEQLHEQKLRKQEDKISKIVELLEKKLEE